MNMIQEIVDLAKLAPGLILLIVVLTNIFKHFGWVKDGESFANTFQLVVSIALTAVGFFLPSLFDWLPYIDEIAESLAEIGAFVIPVYYAIVKLGNAIHNLLTKFTLFGVNRVVAKQLTP